MRLSRQVRAALVRAAITFSLAMIPVLEAYTTSVLDPQTAILMSGGLFALGRTLEGLYDQDREATGNIQAGDVGAFSAPMNTVGVR